MDALRYSLPGDQGEANGKTGKSMLELEHQNTPQRPPVAVLGAIHRDEAGIAWLSWVSEVSIAFVSVEAGDLKSRVGFCFHSGHVET